MEIRKIIGPGLALLVAIGLIGGIIMSARDKKSSDVQKQTEANTSVIRGLIGSEKEGFYRDPRVAAALLKHGLVVNFEKSGSREMAQRTDLAKYDFGHPAGSPAAVKLQRTVKAQRTFNTYYTPMAVASWKKLIPMLEANGLVKQQEGTYYIIDMKQLLKMVADGKRWRDLKESQVYDTGKSVLISSTDVRTSNSAAMYLALASYVLNDGNVVQSDADIEKVMPVASGLFLKQGFQESSSAGPFDDYIGMGMGKAPMVMIYEAQFIEYQAKLPQINTDMVLLYPQPTVFTKHILVPFNDKGRKLGELLETDPELQQIAAEYGYRGASNQHFVSFLKQKKLSAPANLVDVIDPPSFEMLERMVEIIATKFK